MDDNYQTYLNRVARMTLPETYRSQLQHIQESPKFQPRPSGGRQAVPFPGYSVITPPWESEKENSDFYTNLQGCQQQLQLSLESDLIVPVPPASFHLTLADLIWDSAYLYANENSEFEVQLRHTIAQIFQQHRHSLTQINPIEWQILGLIVMTRSVGVCLVPKDQDSYEQILKFRRTIFQNSGLTALGIEQHYHFTAHITLGYFGSISPNLDRDLLSNTLSELNQHWLDSPQLKGQHASSLKSGNPPTRLAPELPPAAYRKLKVHRAELRKFDDMTRYYREPDWPVLNF